GFRKHFLGTHFFNPPRYLKLLEIIEGPDTLPEVTTFISEFCNVRLGKGIVNCKDTPNFIGNRVFAVTGAYTMNYVMENGYTVPEVESITGPTIGRPRTATFRLLDLVGIDVAGHVSSNLAPLIAEDKMAQEALTAKKPASLSKKMIEKGWLGNKTKVGYFKMVRGEGGKKEFWPLNLETVEHEPAGEKPRFDSIGKVRGIEDLGERIKALIAEDDKAAKLARMVMYQSFAYSSFCVPEITDLPSSIDDALRWGFAHEAGPFEIWDKLGVADAIKGMKAEGFKPAAWVQEMLKGGNETFYQYDGDRKTGIYHPEKKKYHTFSPDPHVLSLPILKQGKGIVKRNDGATLIDMGDGIACLEFHTKMNALDEDVITMLGESLDIVEHDFDGMVVGNEGEHFSAGANLFYIVMLAQQEQWEDLDLAVKTLQDAMMRMRYSPKPVVVAPAGLALGGGAEVTMSGSRVVAASELYTGLVEVGVGVIPAGTGTKEMMRRVLNPAMRTPNVDPMPLTERLFMQMGMAKVATSAVEALEMGILRDVDRIILNRDHLLAEAKREARHMADAGYVPPRPEKIYAGGRDVLSTLRVGIFSFREGGYITEYDEVVASKLAYVLTGGDLSKPQWVSEQYILELEREAFLSLCGDKRTQDRLWHMLQKGKPLRN
ncbi:MAG: 3-hydroxyacyl-CoA dehydrogenase family protein, partial [Chloroflexota bacterium]